MFASEHTLLAYLQPKKIVWDDLLQMYKAKIHVKRGTLANITEYCRIVTLVDD